MEVLGHAATGVCGSAFALALLQHTVWAQIHVYTCYHVTWVQMHICGWW